MQLVLPWPLDGLSPNDKISEIKKSKLFKVYKETIFYTVKQQRRSLQWQGAAEGRIDLGIVFHRPNLRHQDLDNAIGSFKAGQDGLALALGVNDKRFRYGPLAPDFGDPKPPWGCVVVDIEEN